MNNGGVTFAECVIIRSDLVFISAQITELNLKGVDHTKVIRWKDGAFVHFMIDWATTALTATSSPLTLLSMGLDGDIHVFQGSNRTHERISGPDNIGPLRDMRLIAGAHYAVGMQRQVYRREGENNWISIAGGIRNQENIKGFNSIDGYSADELYAAGLDGELWAFNGQCWLPLDSPTSIALQRVHCADDGIVYIVGQAGVVLTGRQDRWNFIDLGDFSEDLWGVQTFNGKIFVASSKAVYQLDNGELKKADIGSEGTGSASFLAVADGVLWSVGNRHLAFTSDGITWSALDYDDASY